MPTRIWWRALAGMIASVLATSAWAQPQELFRVSGVAKGDVLNMRSTPSADAPTAGTIPADASGIVRVGKCKAWCQVRFGDTVGWVNRRYLTTVPMAAPSAKEDVTSSDPVGDCNGDDNARKLAGCTAIIDKGQLPAAARAIAYSRRSDAYFEALKPDDAIADRAKAFELQPDDPTYKLKLIGSYTLRGAQRMDSGNLDGALADYDKVIHLDPSRAEAYLARGGAYAQMKKYEQAIADFQMVAKLQGETNTHRKALARLYEMSGVEHLLNKEFDQAISNFTEALEYAAERDVILLRRGLARAGKKDLNGARKDYSAAARINPTRAETYVHLGELARAQGSLDEAVAHLNEAIRHEPRNVVALMMRGLAYEETKQFDEAIADYRSVLAIDSSHKLAAMSLERLGESRRRKPVPTDTSPEPQPEVRKSAITAPAASATPTHSQGIVDGRWTGEWDGISATTILIAGGKVVRYRFRGREVPITRTEVAGKTLTFGDATYTVRVTFESSQRASAQYKNLTRGFTSSAILARQ